jgi:hypothetical protein
VESRRVKTTKPLLDVVHWVRTKSRAPDYIHERAQAAMLEDCELRLEIARLQEQLKAARRAILYPMTDLA